MEGTDTLTGKTVGGYRLLHVLGSGGMGAVYRGVQLAMNREVAIKVLKPTTKVSEKVIKRFRREAYLTSRLEHPNTVNTIDFGEDDGFLYLVLQLLRGQTLSSVLRQRGPLAPRRVAKLGRQICLSLAEAHGLGIVHRDLKPDNVFVCDYEGNPDFIKVVDFGIARMVGDERLTTLTASGALIGTPRYMAPEQVVGGDITPATDLYSLGVMLYEMLSGSPPFRAESVMSLAYKHVHDQPEPLPRTVVDDVWRSLVERLLAKDPRARPESARAVANVLERLELGLPADLSTTDSWEAPLQPDRRTVECAPPATDGLAAAADAYASLGPPAASMGPVQTVGSGATVEDRPTARPQRTLWAAGIGIAAALLVVLGVVLVVALQPDGPGEQDQSSAHLVIDAPHASPAVVIGPDDVSPDASAAPDADFASATEERSIHSADVIPSTAAAAPEISEPEASEPGVAPPAPKPAHLRLTTRPGGATVLRSETFLCTTPCDMEVIANSTAETLVVRLRGHDTEEVLVQLTPGARVADHLDLRPRRPKPSHPAEQPTATASPEKPTTKEAPPDPEVAKPKGTSKPKGPGLPEVTLPTDKRDLPTIDFSEQPK